MGNMNRGKKVDGTTSARNARRKEIKSKGGLGAYQEIQAMLQFTKEDMENALKSPALRISGIMYDIPVFQLKKCLKENKFGLQKFTLRKAKNQDPNQINEVHE